MKVINSRFFKIISIIIFISMGTTVSPATASDNDKSNNLKEKSLSQESSKIYLDVAKMIIDLDTRNKQEQNQNLARQLGFWGTLSSWLITIFGTIIATILGYFSIVYGKSITEIKKDLSERIESKSSDIDKKYIEFKADFEARIKGLEDASKEINKQIYRKYEERKDIQDQEINEFIDTETAAKKDKNDPLVDPPIDAAPPPRTPPYSSARAASRNPPSLSGLSGDLTALLRESATQLREGVDHDFASKAADVLEQVAANDISSIDPDTLFNASSLAAQLRLGDLPLRLAKKAFEARPTDTTLSSRYYRLAMEFDGSKRSEYFGKLMDLAKSAFKTPFISHFIYAEAWNAAVDTGNFQDFIKVFTEITDLAEILPKEEGYISSFPFALLARAYQLNGLPGWVERSRFYRALGMKRIKNESPKSPWYQSAKRDLDQANIVLQQAT